MIKYNPVAGISPGGGIGITSIPQQLVFVDATNGDDGTAVKYDASKPFATIEAAIAVSTSGDSIYVLPGVYTAVDTGAFSWLRITPAQGEINIHCMDGVVWDVTTNQATVGFVMQHSSGFDFSLTGYLKTTVPTAGNGFFFSGSGSSSTTSYLEYREVFSHSSALGRVIDISDNRHLIVRGDTYGVGPASGGIATQGSLDQDGILSVENGVSFITLNSPTAIGDVTIRGDVTSTSNTNSTINYVGNGKCTVYGRIENKGTSGVLEVGKNAAGTNVTISDGATLITAGVESVVESAAGSPHNVYFYKTIMNAGVNSGVNIVVPDFTIDANVI